MHAAAAPRPPLDTDSNAAAHPDAPPPPSLAPESAAQAAASAPASASQAKPLPVKPRPQQPPRVVQSAAGAGTGFLRQLAESLPADAAARHLDAYLPDFLRAYTGASAADTDGDGARETVLCARVQLIPLRGNAGTRRVVLLGYRDGFQAWKLEDSGAATEMCNARGGDLGAVALCHVVQPPSRAPSADAGALAQRLASARPLLALAGGAASHTPDAARAVTLYSLRTCSARHVLRMDGCVTGVQSSARFLAVALRARVVVLDAQTLEPRTEVSCQPAASLRHEAVFALGDRFLAVGAPPPQLGPREDVCVWRDAGGDGGGLESPLADAAARAAKELWRLGELGRQTLADRRGSGDGSVAATAACASAARGQERDLEQDVDQDRDEHRDRDRDHGGAGGGVLVRDLCAPGAAAVAHFAAHAAPLELLRFDPSGALLAVSARGGQAVHVHRIFPARPAGGPTAAAGLPVGAAAAGLASAATGGSGSGSSGNGTGGGAVAATQRLVCRLLRGRTSAVIRDVAFSNDLRWAVVTSARGTAHVFAINAQGGPATARSHPTLDAARMREAGVASESGMVGGSSVGGSSSGGGGGEGASWGLRDRLSSLSGSLTSGVSSSLSPAAGTLSSSLGSLSSRGSDLLALAASAGSGGGGGLARSADARAPPVALTPVLAPAALGGRLRDAEPVTATALARVRLRTRANILRAHRRTAAAAGKGAGGEPAGADAEHADADADSDAALGAAVVSAVLDGSALLTATGAGLVEQFQLAPARAERDARELCLRALPWRSWDVCRRRDWPEFRRAAPLARLPSSPSLSASGTGNPSQAQPQQPQQLARAAGPSGDDGRARAEWMACAEIDTHAAPLTAIWAAPQFTFAEFASEDGAAPLLVERLRSDPVLVRGRGPAPSFARGEQAETLHSAMRTPAAVAQLREAADGDLEHHVLVFDDDDMSPRADGPAGGSLDFNEDAQQQQQQQQQQDGEQDGEEDWDDDFAMPDGALDLKRD